MRKLRPILFASFFFSLHLALVAYINSSVLGTLLSPKGVSLVFIASSCLSLLLVRRAATLVQKFGNVLYMASILGLSIILLLVLAISHNSTFAILAFIPYFALNSLILYGFDVFFEHFSKRKKMGGTRGAFLSLNYLAWIGMPAFVGFLESRYGFGVIYLFAAFAATTAFATIFFKEQHYHDTKYVRVSLRHMLRTLLRRSPVRTAIVINLTLQFFYVWMVVYCPLYLYRVIGLGWDKIGIIFSIMLIPFVIFEYPTGRLADKYLNERPLIAVGFFIMGTATMIFSLMNNVGIAGFAVILFMTRMGASIVESANECYFFRNAPSTDTMTVAVYRNMTPLAYTIGPLIALLIIGTSRYTLLFFILGLIMLTSSVLADYKTTLFRKQS